MVSSRCLQDATMNITDAWKHLLILTKISVAEEKFNALSDLLQYVNLVGHSCFFFFRICLCGGLGWINGDRDPRVESCDLFCSIFFFRPREEVFLQECRAARAEIPAAATWIGRDGER